METAAKPSRSAKEGFAPRIEINDTAKSDIFCVKFAPDDNLVASACEDGNVKVYSTVNGKLLYTLNTAQGESPVTSIRFRPTTTFTKTKNVLLVASASGAIQHWHVSTGKLLHTIQEEGNQVYAVDYNKDGAMFCSTGKDRKIRVYDEATKSLKVDLFEGDGTTTVGHTNRVYAVKFHPGDDNYVLSAGWDNTLQIWDLRADRSVRSIFGPYVCGEAIDMSGNTILTGSWRPEDQLQLWDFGSGRLIKTIPWPADETRGSSMVYAAQFSKLSSKYVLATGSHNTDVALFETESGRRVGTIGGSEKTMYSVDFAPDDATAAIAGGDGKIILANVPA